MAEDFSGATVVFDLDGTLVDTAPDLVRALNLTIAARGLAPVPLSAVRRIVGQGARVMIARAAALAGAELDAQDLDGLTATFIDHYRAGIALESRPFEGCIAALDELHGLGAVLAVCTNKRTDLARQLLDALGMSPRFAAILGADAVPARKPDPGHLLATIEAAGGDRRCAVMVGDSAADVSAAQGAQTPVIVAAFGYCDVAPSSLGADAVMDTYADLAPLVRRLLGARAQTGPWA